MCGWRRSSIWVTDQTFVRNLIHSAKDLALCEAIIVMAHKLGIKVIAE